MEKHFNMCSNREGDWHFHVTSLLRNFPKEMSTVHANEPEVIWGPLQNMMYASTLVVARVRIGLNPRGLITLREVGMELGAPDHMPVVPAEFAMRDWLGLPVSQGTPLTHSVPQFTALLND